MTKNELIALLRLQHIPNIGDITAKKIISHLGSPAAIFEDKPSHLLKIDGIGRRTVTGLFDPIHLEAAEEEYEFICREGISCWYYQEEDYPELLKHCIDGPVLLFARGKIHLQNKRILSVVGTRKCTRYGMEFSRGLIQDLAPLNPVIISGFAYGIDICVQKAAMECNLQTIACLAHGLNQIYPKVHSRHLPPMERHGGVLTEFWSSSDPDRENFLKRNRIIAGISEATVVVESAEKGGSLVTADIANSYDREVFALPGRADDPYSVGCNSLIKRHRAHLITSAADLIYMLNWDLPPEGNAKEEKMIKFMLEPEELKIYSQLRLEGIQLLEDIARSCNLPVFRVSSSLVSMEMKGAVRPLPGKLFEAK